ncbi:MAG: response regulator transcription factor [Cytophagales bacterium]|nr:response regulator transcription factor [Cytophagales bacterium]
MNCIIIEDQPPAQRILKKYIDDYAPLQLLGTFSDATLAMEYLKTERIDLIFLDIHLPKLSGMDFIKALTNPPHVILTTAYSEYALESYEYDVVDYLLKPFSFQRFIKAVLKVPSNNPKQYKSGDSSQESRGELFIKSGYEYVKIKISDILYIQSDTDYTEIYTSAMKYVSSEPLHYWRDKLNNSQFVRVHKSYIVNVSKIVKIAGNRIHLSEQIIIPIGRTFKDNFRMRFMDK